jgi:hypothetical protein
MKYELQDLISGKGGISKAKFIRQITDHLRASKTTGSGPEGQEYTREQEEANLMVFINENKLWYTGLISDYAKIGEGSEQKVYYDAAKGTVTKTNDAIFFAYWLDYLNNLIVHNYFFPDTLYSLLGFRKIAGVLCAIVEQPHIVSTEAIDLEKVSVFLENNGFSNTRRNDYFNDELGIILEDLHDENVISSGGMPYFIDTVFYLTDKFYAT